MVAPPRQQQLLGLCGRLVEAQVLPEGDRRALGRHLVEGPCAALVRHDGGIAFAAETEGVSGRPARQTKPAELERAPAEEVNVSGDKAAVLGEQRLQRFTPALVGERK